MISREEAEELLAYMVPGTTVEDLMYDDEDEDDDDDYEVVTAKSGGTEIIHTNPNSQANRQQPSSSLSKVQPQQHTLQKSVLSKIRVEDCYDACSQGTGAARMNQRVLNEIRGAAAKSSERHQTKDVDRSERATVEQVMDPRTRMILYKLVNTGQLTEINGCVSTGKEANVYFAVRGNGEPAAIKVYKTSILIFKDREQYVAGEFRFQRYCKGNPRKMVRTWAEKEARNLTRLANNDVPAPKVLILRQHVLVMEFLGEDGWPAPRLKEVKFPNQIVMDRCYLNLLSLMRVMFMNCKLVHGDLSEYNLLFHRGEIYIIDVSQSVEHDHPQAMNFLKRDIVNVNRFFSASGHQEVLSLQQVFRFITTVEGVPAEREKHAEYLLRVREESCEEDEVQDDGEEGNTQQQQQQQQAQVDEQVFLNMHFPRTLDQLDSEKQPNREVASFVQDLLAVKQKTATAQDKEADVNNSSCSDSASDDEEEEDAGDGKQLQNGGGKSLAEMTKDERKEHKKSVKLQNRERREHKKEREKKHKSRRVKHK
jgi:RIO kinase 1